MSTIDNIDKTVAIGNIQEVFGTHQKGQIMTDKNEFKVGDVVYEVSEFLGVVWTTLAGRQLKTQIPPLQGQFSVYREDGLKTREHKLPSIFHATPENYAKLYSVWGDAVPKLPPSEIMTELLKEGAHTALVSDISVERARFNARVRLIASRNLQHWLDVAGNYWKYAIPCDSRGNEITELP